MISTTRNMALMFMALAVVSSGGMFALGQELESTNATPLRESGGIVGHVTAVVTDNDGNVKQYMQTDNIILDMGKNAIIDEVFGLTTASAFGTADFVHIGLGALNATAVAETDGQTSFTAEDINCPKEDATAGGGNSLGLTATAGAPVLNYQVVFDGSVTNCDTQFGRAGLTNNAAFATGDIIAVTNFGTSVTLSTTDTLTLDWDFTFN